MGDQRRVGFEDETLGGLLRPSEGCEHAIERRHWKPRLPIAPSTSIGLDSIACP